MGASFPQSGPMRREVAFLRSRYCLREIQDKQRATMWFRMHEACEKGDSSVIIPLYSDYLREELKEQGYQLRRSGLTHNYQVSWAGEPKENK